MSHMIESLLQQYGETVTHQARSLDTDNRDAETGWPPVTYTDSEIIMYIEPLSTRTVTTGGEPVEEKRFKGYSVTLVNRYDRIVRGSDTFLVEFLREPYKKGSTILYYRTILLQVS